MSSTIARCDHHWEIWFIIALSDGGVSTEPYPQRAIDCSEKRHETSRRGLSPPSFMQEKSNRVGAGRNFLASGQGGRWPAARFVKRKTLRTLRTIGLRKRGHGQCDQSFESP